MARHERLYRRLLLVLPRAFRLEAEPELIATFHLAHDRSRTRGPVALLLFWTRTVLDLLLTSVAERRFTHRVPFDIRMAFRSLTHTPGFTAAAVITFALGIGINLAVWSVVDRITFRPLPYADADRLVHVRGASARSQPSPTAFLSSVVPSAVAAGAPGFEAIAMARGGGSPVTLDDGTSLAFDQVSRNLLEVLGVTVAAGRDFAADDESPDFRRGTVLLSHETWTQRFGRSHDVFTRPLTAGRATYHVVGVLPPNFLVPSSAFDGRRDGVLLEALRTRPATPAELGPAAIGRLRPGVGLAQAQAEVEVVMQQLRQQHQGSILDRMPMVAVQPLESGLFEFYRPYAWIVLAGVSGVLLIGCVNLTTLFLARGRSRAHIAAIQSALGGSRTHIMRATIVEAVTVCLLGAGVAVGLCALAFPVILSLVPTTLVTAAVSPLDPRLVGITTLVALMASLLAGGVSAFRASRHNVMAGLRRQTRSSTGALRGGATLLACQAALGVVLVAGAAATVRSFAGIVLENPGYQVDDLYNVSVQHGYARDQPRNNVGRIRQVEQTVREFPGVVAAGSGGRFLTGFPFSDDAFWTARGQSGTRVGIGSGLFRTLDTHMPAGREFTDDEVHQVQLVAIVNQTAAAQLWPGAPPGDVVGRTLTTPDGVRTVVGVAQDVRRQPGAPIVATVFVPVTAPEAPLSGSAVALTVRTAPGQPLDVAGLDARLDELLGSNNLPTTSVADLLPQHLQQPRFQAMLFGLVAVVGLLLSVTGLYAVAAFDVARRRFELGVRLALGATPADVHAQILRTVVRPVVVGTVAGLAVAWWLGQFLQAFLFEVDARDPWTALLVAAVLLATALVAGLFPARRAARTDPAIVLRAS